MPRFFCRLFFLASLVALGGCGLKGPLYMPSAHAEAGHQHGHAAAARAPAAAASSAAPALPPDDDSAGTGGPRS